MDHKLILLHTIEDCIVNLLNYIIIFRDLNKALFLFSNVLYGWCPKCRQTHKTMYSRVEGYVSPDIALFYY